MWWCQYWLCGGVGHSRVEAISQIRSAVGRKASARATGRFHFPGSPNAVVCLGGPIRGQGCIPQEVTVLLCRDRGPVWEHLEPLDRAPSASRLRHPIKSESSASVSPGRTPLPPPHPPRGPPFQLLPGSAARAWNSGGGHDSSLPITLCPGRGSLTSAGLRAFPGGRGSPCHCQHPQGRAMPWD